MSQAIMVGTEIYEKLKVLMRATGPKASFNTIITELLRNSAGSAVQERIFLSFVRGHFQRLEIQAFVNVLLDQDLIDAHTTPADVTALVMLVINGQWEKLNTLVALKAEFIEQALATFERKKEMLELERAKLNGKTQSNNLDGIGVNGASVVTGIVPKSEKTIGSMPGGKVKSKRTSSKTAKRKSTKH